MTVFPAHHKKSVIKPLIVALWLASPSFIAVAEDSPPLMEPPFLEAATEQADPIAKTPPPAQNTVTNGLFPIDQDGQNGLPTAEPPSTEAPTLPLPKPKPQKRPPLLGLKPPASKLIKPDNHSLKTGVTIHSKQGITETVEVARNKLNRIVTPYANPKVLTVDNVETKIDGSAVYVATDMESPVSLFISDVETGQATSLQLLPVNLATPIEIRIESDRQPDNNNPASLGLSPEPEKPFRQESDYLSDIKSMMQTLAKQQVPSGFSLDEKASESGVSGLCHNANLAFSYGQTFVGQDMHIVVLVAENKSFAPKVFEEAFCASESVMAVSSWPKIRLNPGDKTEIFVLIRNGQERDVEYRPSLL
jgi:conjugal transfer pilus assembly protein TraK